MNWSVIFIGWVVFNSVIRCNNGKSEYGSKASWSGC